jgi:hypothetical protein
MTPIAVAKEIGRIEMELKKNPIQTQKITNAPPPINPVGGQENVSGKKPDEMTQAEFDAWRKSQGARPF